MHSYSDRVAQTGGAPALSILGNICSVTSARHARVLGFEVLLESAKQKLVCLLLGFLAGMERRDFETRVQHKLVSQHQELKPSNVGLAGLADAIEPICRSEVGRVTVSD